MPRSAEDFIRLQFGNLNIQMAVLSAENEALKEQIAELTAKEKGKSDGPEHT